MKSRFILLAILFLLCFTAFAQDSRRYVTRAYRPNADSTAAQATVPTWTGTQNGFTYRMVGQDPSSTLSNPSTTIGVSVVPLILTFGDGTIMDSSVSDAVCSTQGSPSSLLMNSPIFQDRAYTAGATNAGTTQYEDFFQRSNFYQATGPSGVNPNYHLLLAPTLLQAIPITVPQKSGTTVKAGCGRLGQVDINWLDNYLTGTVFKQLAGMGVLPSNMVVFQMYNVAAYDTSVTTCCILGYHSAFDNPNFSNAIQMYAVGDFDTTGNFGTTRDVSALSHELGEWIDDPLGDNATPSWGNVGQVSGCQTDLEVGDPLSGKEIPLAMPNGYTYHVQELAFLNWFFRQTPSGSVNGWYSSNGTFTTFAPPCNTTRTTLSITPATLAPGATVTVAIAVKATGNSAAALPVPTGTVTLLPRIHGKAIATYTLTSGAVNTTLSTLPSGSYSVTADYAGDANFSPRVSAAVTVNVGTSTVVLSPAALAFGNRNVGTAGGAQTVTLTNKG